MEAVPAIWTARLRTDRVAIFRANASKISNAVAAASVMTVVVEDLAGATVLAVEDSAVIALGEVAVDLGAAALAASVVVEDLAVPAAVADDDN